LVGAVSLVIDHNHPSNVVTPSKCDLAATVRVRDAAELLGVRFLNHDIVTEFSYFSFKESDEGWDQNKTA
jgi:DNA repair protein RadC